MQCGKPEKGSYFTKFTIAIAPKELKVTICERETAIELEQELLRRGQVSDMHFPQPAKTDSRNSGKL